MSAALAGGVALSTRAIAQCGVQSWTTGPTPAPCSHATATPPHVGVPDACRERPAWTGAIVHVTIVTRNDQTCDAAGAPHRGLGNCNCWGGLMPSGPGRPVSPSAPLS